MFVQIPFVRIVCMELESVKSHKDDISEYYGAAGGSEIPGIINQDMVFSNKG